MTVRALHLLRGIAGIPLGEEMSARRALVLLLICLGRLGHLIIVLLEIIQSSVFLLTLESLFLVELRDGRIRRLFGDDLIDL